MLSSRSQLNQDIIQNAQGELTCWPTFDKLRGTHDSFFSPFIFIQITTTSPNETKCIMLENTGTEEWFLSTQRIRKAEYAGTLVWYCAHWTEPVIQQCIQQVGWKLKKKRKNSLHHASFTYVLTAITSPMMHFCVERRRQVIRRNLHVHQLWQTSSRAYNHISSHCQTYLLKNFNYINLPQVCCDVFISCKTPHFKTNTFFLIILTGSLSINSTF